jgi:eukaryotic-like serine/threonine-protein kinase
MSDEGDQRSFIKRLSPRERTEPEAVARRRSEARLLGLLSESGVTPRLIAAGEDAQGPWHRIERIAIPTLAERLAHVPPPHSLEPAWMERAIRRAYDALAILHEAGDEAGPLGIVHADLSPANIAIDDDASRVVLLDLDLAVWRESPARMDGAFRGTIGYVAPEIARGDAPTQLSDLFALAAALVHGATGRSPRPTGGTMPFAALLAMAAEGPVLEPEIEALAARGLGHAALVACLTHEPARRPGSARAVNAAWARACGK